MESEPRRPFRLGYWLSEKKAKKLQWDAFLAQCRDAGVQAVSIDLSRPVAEQGPLDVLVHKASDLLVLADEGDPEATMMVHNLETFDGIFVDPLPGIRQLCDRGLQYRLLSQLSAVSTPAFVELRGDAAAKDDEEAEVTEFPVVCKPLVAHGSTRAHQMSLVFNSEGLRAVKRPCVAQKFVAHDSILYKVFVVGDRWWIFPRPSLKNFEAGDGPNLSFHSHSVCKEGCASSLSDFEVARTVSASRIDRKRVERAVAEVRAETGLRLFGLDVVVERGTGRHFVIDANAFPSYDGVEEFPEELLRLVTSGSGDRGETSGGELSEKPVSLISIVFSDSGISSCTESGEDSDAKAPLRPRPAGVKQFYGIPKVQLALPPNKSRPSSLP